MTVKEALFYHFIKIRLYKNCSDYTSNGLVRLEILGKGTIGRLYQVSTITTNQFSFFFAKRSMMKTIIIEAIDRKILRWLSSI